MSDLNDNLNNGENQQIEAGISTVEPDNVQSADTEQPSFAETELVSGVEPVKKKPVLLIAAIIVLVLAAGSAAAYNFIPFVKNNVKMLISKPEKYYAWVEEENLKGTADNISDAYGKVLNSIGKQNESEFELKADIDSENVKALIESISGSSLSESGITLPSSISFKTGAKVDGGNTSGSMQMSADGNLLASANVYMQDNKYYVQIPDLSTAYLSMDFKSVMDEAMAKAGGSANEFIDGFMNGYTDTLSSLTADPESIKEMLSEKELNELITKYFQIVFENIDDVELEKGVSCNVNGEKVKYNKLSANIDQGSLYNICKAALKEAKKDKTIIKIVEKFGLSNDDYTSTIDGLLETLGTVEVSGGDTMFTMNVYTDSSGKICGRDIEIPDEEDKTISFMTAKKGSDNLIDVEIMDFGEGIKITGKSTEKSGKKSGDIKCELIGTSDGDIEIPISYKDYEIVNEDKGYCKGSFTIKGNFTTDLASSEGSSITLDFDSDGKGQTIKTDININDTKYGMITLSTKEKNSIEIPAFDSSQKVYQITNDGTDIQQYLIDSEDTLPGFIDNIGSAFGVRGLGQLFGAALGGSSLEDDDDFIETEDDIFDTDSAEDVKYDLSKVNIQVSGQTIPLPAKISGILDLVKVEDAQIEASGFASYYSDDYSFGVNLRNDSDAAAAPADCTVTGIHISGVSANITVSADGFTIGSPISDVAAKYGAILSDSSSGFVSIVDTKSDWNSMTFYYYDGKVDSISITYYEY